MLKLSAPKVFSCHFPIFTTLKADYMEEVKSLFDRAVEESETLKQKPSNETLLMLYSLYKQATIGDTPNEPPANPFDFVAKAKFEAWSSLKGKSKNEAQMDYINLINKLKS